MVRNIVVLGLSSHPQLTQTICNHLGIPPGKILLGKFAVGETRVEIIESVREKDVFIVQAGGRNVNDDLMEMLITISACKTASARRVTAVLPLFPYSRQSDIPYNKTGAPLAKAPTLSSLQGTYTFNSRPQTPHPSRPESTGLKNGPETLTKKLRGLQTNGVRDFADSSIKSPMTDINSNNGLTANFAMSPILNSSTAQSSNNLQSPAMNGVNIEDPTSKMLIGGPPPFEPQPGYKQWVAQAGTLIADLVTVAGADHVITMDLHDPQYQGFFDIPVDNLYGRRLLHTYIQTHIPDYQQAIIVSPDAGGAKRATAIADALGIPFALIHKDRRPSAIVDRQNAAMLLVGEVEGRVAILIDDLADTCNTITRAAKLLKKEKATSVIALVTHGVLSGDAIQRVNASALDKLVVTNTVDQKEHAQACPKLEVLEVGQVFAEVFFTTFIL